jgi:hypothetical protein
MEVATSEGMFMGMKQDLWKLIASLVAAAKLSRIHFRAAALVRSARQIMSVSSAYWSTGQGREGSIGCTRVPEEQAHRIMR